MFVRRAHREEVELNQFLAAFICLGLASGVPRREETPRIAIDGSVEAKITDFPYTIALRKGPPTGRKLICTGSILHTKWVLTAAHCVKPQDDPRYFDIKAGIDRVQDFNDNATQTRQALEIRTHPKYWAGKVSKYDVAVIKVEDFVFNDRVQPIKPYAEDWSSLPKVEDREYRVEMCQAIGWGQLEISISSDTLRYANVTARHGTQACGCFQMYLQRRLICNAAKDIGGVCPGDSGGPLVCNGSVAGVAHVIYHRASCKWDYFGTPELKCNSPEVVSAWMYVCPMLDFIGKHVPDIPSKPASCRAVQKIGFSAVIVVLPTTLSCRLMMT